MTLELPPIPPIDTTAERHAHEHQTRLTKPTGALGRLEDLSIRLAGMTGRLDWLPVRRAVIVCAADHGVAAQGVSAYPQAVTAQMVRNFLNGGAAINVLARQMGAHVIVVDAGVAAEFDAHPDLVAGKIAYGTADISAGAAMSSAQADASVQLGLAVMQREIERGVDIVAVGEMGIGNTTAASAVIAAITGRRPSDVTGRGTGVDEDQLLYKIAIIGRALHINRPAPHEALHKVGGFELGAMAGVMISAAAVRIPVLIDGLISSAAALIAMQLAPDVSRYLIASHRSVEPGHAVALQTLGLTPLFDLGLRLGEGTGAVLAIPLVEAAMRILQEMATFDTAGVSNRDVG